MKSRKQATELVDRLEQTIDRVAKARDPQRFSVEQWRLRVQEYNAARDDVIAAMTGGR